MITVHHSQADKYRSGPYYVQAAEIVYGLTEPLRRFTFVQRASVCGAECASHERRYEGRVEITAGVCLLPKGHTRGHTSLVYFCDGCGKGRRGEPYRSNEDVALCFPCAKADEREYERRQYDLYA